MGEACNNIDGHELGVDFIAANQQQTNQALRIQYVLLLLRIVLPKQEKGSRMNEFSARRNRSVDEEKSMDAFSIRVQF